MRKEEMGRMTETYAYDANGNVTRTEYCGNCVYVGGKLKRLLFPGGYATPKAMGSGYDYHYFVTDYLGSVRAVVAEDGAVEEASSYYPYGMQAPDEKGSIQQTQPYKYGGKERLTAAGVNLYDFGPRALYSPAAQFTSMDPKCEEYPHLSPYLYCAANPANAIDPTGEDVAVLYFDNWHGHMALLVQNSEGEWLYYSYNGVGFSKADRQKDDKGVNKGWKSPLDFLKSNYNRKADTDAGEKHKSDDFCDYNYTKAYVITTKKEQDQKIIEYFEKCIDQEEYNLLTNNCAEVVLRSLEAGGVIKFSITMTSSNYYSPTNSWGTSNCGYVYMDVDIPVSEYMFIPYVAYNLIKLNTRGKEITEKKK